MAEIPTPKQFQVQEAFELKPGDMKLPGELLMIGDDAGANSLYESGHIAHFDDVVEK
jgi:hypothetical protein